MIIEIFVSLLGLAVGSFLNVCIHRLPQGESVLTPRSYCPQCRRGIRWFDNIPILSFILLGGRCRNCRNGISLRYPAVELLSGFLWFWSWRTIDGSSFFLIQVMFLSLLLVVTVTDFETGLIPDSVTFTGLVTAPLLSVFNPSLQGPFMEGEFLSPAMALGKSLAGILVGGGLIYLTGIFGNLLFRKESMGGGDVKLLAMIGGFIGWEKALLTFFTAPILALPFALYMKWFKKAEIIPYGPFLALAGVIQFIYGNQLWRYYFNL